ncbi:MAG: hypothetical protein ACKO2G_08530 [Verrucomicrobiales bacterium]
MRTSTRKAARRCHCPALEPGEAWPDHEARRFIKGWDTLRLQAQDNPDPILGVFLRNLLVPDPVTRTNCYRIYLNVNGVPRLHVLWGTVAKDSRQQSLPTSRVCELVRIGLTTSAQTVRPVATAVSFKGAARDEAEASPPQENGHHLP